jgi:hypothetical protein
MVEALFFYAPYHLFAAAVLEGLIFALRKFGSCLPTPPPAIRTGLAFTGAFILVAATIAAPFGWREIFFELTRRAARTRADQDWQAQTAVIYRWDYDEEPANDLYIMHDFDPETGLRWGDHFGRFFGYDKAYDQRVRELLSQHGIPAWSMKTHVSDAELVALLDADDMEEITELPYDVSDSITICRRGTSPTRWVSGNDGLSLATKPGATIDIDDYKLPIYLRISPTDPQVIFIRHGRERIMAYHIHGEFLSYAYRPPQHAPPADE